MKRLLWLLLMPTMCGATELARSDAGDVSIVIYDTPCKSNPAAEAARMIDAKALTYYDGCYDLDTTRKLILFEWSDGTHIALPAGLFHISAPQATPHVSPAPKIKPEFSL